MAETGTSSYLDRMNLTNEISTKVVELLQQNNFIVEEFGYEAILKDPLPSLLRRRVGAGSSEAALMMKYAPDYIVAFDSSGKKPRLFLIDVKVSITPIFFKSRIKYLKRLSKEPLQRYDIGEIEREAWHVYNKHFPPNDVAIIYAAPFNPKLILANWVKNIKSIYKYSKNRVDESSGSGTPYVNINLNTLIGLDDFLKNNFNVQLEKEKYTQILDLIKRKELSKPNKVNWIVFNKVVTELKNECPWLECRFPKKVWTNNYGKIQEQYKKVRKVKRGSQIDYIVTPKVQNAKLDNYDKSTTSIEKRTCHAPVNQLKR
ncbi:MAG: hypothetical protein QW279_00735 [Candidatus Jordarchaeaceae archaeon]